MLDKLRDHPAFLAGGGEMGARMRAHNWTATALGSPETWPDALRTTVSVVLNSALLGTVLWGPELHMLYNDTYAPALAERHPNALGRPLSEVWADIWPYLSPQFLRVLHTGEPYSETRFALPMTRNSKPVMTYWNYSVAPIRDGAGKIVGLLNQALEITREVEVEAQLRASEARNRQILESATDYAIVATDLRGRVTRWNEGAYRVIGWTEQEMLGQQVHRFFTPEDNAKGQVDREMEAALRTGHGTDERWHLRKDGRRFWASGQMTPLKTEGGEVVGFVKVLCDHTAQRLAAAELERSEQRYRTLYNAIDLGFCIVEVQCDDSVQPLDYRFLEVNAAFEVQTGLTEATGRWMRNLAPEHEQYWFERYAEIARTGQSARFEYTAHALGERYFEVYAYRIGHPDEHHVAILFSDVTERKRAEMRQAALLDLNDRLREVTDLGEMAFIASEVVGRAVNATTTGYATMDPDEDGAVIDRSWAVPGVTSLVGHHRMRTLGTYVENLRCGEDVVIPDVRLDPRTVDGAAVLEKQDIRAFVNLPIIEDGRMVALFFVVCAAPRQWRKEDLAFIRDVAGRTRTAVERRRAESNLRASEAQHRQSLQQMPGFVAVMSGPEHVYQFINDAYVALGGPRDYIGHSVRDVFPEVVGQGFFEPLDHAYATGEAYVIRSAPIELAAGIGQRFIDLLFQPIRSENGVVTGVFAGGYDVTDRVRAEQHLTDLTNSLEQQVEERTRDLVRTEDALRQSQKMEAVGQLTGGLAHDFNNLLTGVTGSLELLQTRIAQGRIKDVDRYVTAAQGAAKRAAALTHRLLAFSRRQTLAPKPTDVSRLVHGMEDLIRRSVGPAITMEPLVEAAGLWPTLIDPGQLENALLNLCINARDAMPDGGQLTIEASNQWLEERAARELDLLPGPYVLLCVSDTGTGMSEDVIAKAFDPFFTTKPIGMGTGLGLSMIYGFAKQSGGQARIHSQLGQGATVCLYLPRHVGDAEAAEPDAELVDAPRAENGQTVLVVDDEPTVRMLVTDVLEDLGYTAIEAADGAAGLKVLQSDARIDLLVTDVGLPGGMNGRQVADAARVGRPELKVLFITGYAESAVLSHGHLDPGMHVLTKPFAMEALASRIKDLLSN